MTHIEEGLDFTLSHFQEPIWPRAISTKTTECRQVLVNNRDVGSGEVQTVQLSGLQDISL